jgi:predicted small lipoprotein YifL
MVSRRIKGASDMKKQNYILPEKVSKVSRRELLASFGFFQRFLPPASFSQLFVLAAAMICIAGCGVKGNPVPPDTPPEIGKGRPDISTSSEELMIPVEPPVLPTPTKLAPRKSKDAQ